MLIVDVLPEAPIDVHARLIAKDVDEQPDEVLITWDAPEGAMASDSNETYSVFLKATKMITPVVEETGVKPEEEVVMEEQPWILVPKAENLTERRVSIAVVELNMEKDKQYEFQVIAKNTVGKSQPAQAPELVSLGKLLVQIDLEDFFF